MDSACGFRQSSMLFSPSSGSRRSRALEFSHLKSGVRNKISCFGSKYLETSRLMSRKCLLVKSVRTSFDPYRHSASRFGRDLHRNLRILFLRESAVGSCGTVNGVTMVRCQGNDSVAYINGDDRELILEEVSGDGNLMGDASRFLESDDTQDKEGEEGVVETPGLGELRELLQKALRELEVSRLNSAMFEERAQKISEAAIALKDKAANARNDVDATIDMIEAVVKEEVVAKEAVQKATMAFSLAEARLQVAMESLEAIRARNTNLDGSGSELVNESEEEAANLLKREEEALLVAQEEIKYCRCTLETCEAELRRLQNRKDELQKEVDRLNEVAEQLQVNALKADEDVSDIMLLAEQAVALEVEASQRVSDAAIALQRAESSRLDAKADAGDISILQSSPPLKEDDLGEEEVIAQVSSGDNYIETVRDLVLEDPSLTGRQSPEGHSDMQSLYLENSYQSDNLNDKERGKFGLDSARADMEAEMLKNAVQTKKQQEAQKDISRDSSPFSGPKALLKKSSRFFSASFFSFAGDGTEFRPASVLETGGKQLPKLIVGFLLFGAGIMHYFNRSGMLTSLVQQPDVITTSIEEASSNAKPLIRQIQKLPKRLKKLIQSLPQQEQINEEEASLFDVLWLLLASVIFVPLFQKIPGGSPVLGYLAAGILIGPYGLSIIRHVHGTKAIAEFGVVFLLFNIGLELSVERLSSMKKYVFGLGSAQVLITAAVVGFVAHFLGQPGPAGIVIGNGLALSSTAVVLQVLQERGESTSRHGRATFSVLLFQDLAVVVLLILIPLISPNSSKGGVTFFSKLYSSVCVRVGVVPGLYSSEKVVIVLSAASVGFQAIAEALGLAAIKAIVAIAAIVAGGRLLLRPTYKQIAENRNAEIFSANTLLVILGTSLLTARAGLSMALGAFLAGLLLAETEFSLQVESDIAPYRGLLLGLFFMTFSISLEASLLHSHISLVKFELTVVGMSIDPKLLVSNFPVVMGTLGLLIVGKTALVALVGKIFGLSVISAIRVGLLLAPGGEFAFVAFGEAVNQVWYSA
ncbi:hypothetical protein Dimus_006510 [Dionaea muscipula]